MTKNDVMNKYFEWLYDIVCKKRYYGSISYKKLLMTLHNIEFTYSLKRDENREEDGLSLRHRFAVVSGIRDAELYLNDPCSVLEMLIALAIRCEERIMDNPDYDDRTKQWFWGMITNLGLGSMTDDLFDKNYVKSIINRFLRREYEPDGKGGLFTIKNRNEDLRDVEIWIQLCWYLDNIANLNLDLD